MTDCSITRATIEETIALAESFLPVRGNPDRADRAREVGFAIIMAGVAVAHNGGDKLGMAALRDIGALVLKAAHDDRERQRQS